MAGAARHAPGGTATSVPGEALINSRRKRCNQSFPGATKPDTRTRILVATLTLFNEQGEPNTTTNAIADEVDISPGNLHYHFRKKAELVGALLNEFQADAGHVLEPPADSAATIEDFWAFLQSLVELLAADRFLLRDTETLVATYPNVRKALAGFSRALLGVMRIYQDALQRDGTLDISAEQQVLVARVLVIIVMFSERFDDLGGKRPAAEVAATQIARSVLGVLQPYGSSRGKAVIAEMLRHYR